MTLRDYLLQLWRDLRNNASKTRLAYVRGALDALLAATVLSSDEHELWERRFATCPGHDDEGGRRWCAYCGDLPADRER